MRSHKVPHLVFLHPPIAELLRAKAARTGMTKSQVLSDAIWYMDENERDRVPAADITPALTQMQGQLASMGRTQEQSRDVIDLTIEMLRCFIQHQLTLSAHEPPFDDEAVRIGKERFARLLDYAEGYLAEHGMKAESKKLH